MQEGKRAWRDGLLFWHLFCLLLFLQMFLELPGAKQIPVYHLTILTPIISWQYSVDAQREWIF